MQARRLGFLVAPCAGQGYASFGVLGTQIQPQGPNRDILTSGWNHHFTERAAGYFWILGKGVIFLGKQSMGSSGEPG